MELRLSHLRSKASNSFNKGDAPNSLRGLSPTPFGEVGPTLCEWKDPLLLSNANWPVAVIVFAR